MLTIAGLMTVALIGLCLWLEWNKREGGDE